MIRLLVVDDDFRVARLHAELAGRVAGVEVVGIAHTAAEAVQLAAECQPDLVLLDEHLPDERGSALVGRLAAAVLVISADNESAAVARAVAGGAIGVVLKPFPPQVLTARLDAFVKFRRLLDGAGSLDQQQVDRAFAVLHGGAGSTPVAKGRSAVTAESIRGVLEAGNDTLTAADVAAAIGVSRATAQRYLSDLVQAGRVELSLRYGATGRPEHRYSWRG